jgi:hypothetical protein
MFNKVDYAKIRSEEQARAAKSISVSVYLQSKALTIQHAGHRKETLLFNFKARLLLRTAKAT